jgi:hypothetical protein
MSTTEEEMKRAKRLEDLRTRVSKAEKELDDARLALAEELSVSPAKQMIESRYGHVAEKRRGTR